MHRMGLECGYIENEERCDFRQHTSQPPIFFAKFVLARPSKVNFQLDVVYNLPTKLSQNLCMKNCFSFPFRHVYNYFTSRMVVLEHTLQCQNLVPTRAFGTKLWHQQGPLAPAWCQRPLLAPSFGTLAWCPRTSFLLVFEHQKWRSLHFWVNGRGTLVSWLHSFSNMLVCKSNTHVIMLEI
jgi:hypothetical protein